MADIHMPDDGKSTGKVVWHATMSLDGFIAGLQDSMDWAFEYGGEPDSMA
jgi:hypothetical protein